MADKPASESKDKSSDSPEPEVLRPQVRSTEDAAPTTGSAPKAPIRSRRITYRPSHKATFIGAAVVIAILSLNVGGFLWLMRDKGGTEQSTQREAVTLSTETLDRLGVSRNAVGDLGTELTIGPNTTFNGKVTIAGDASVGGQLRLNGKFSATDASFARLEAGNTAVNQLNVNGDATATNLNLRRDLVIAGATRLQGPVTISQLLTITNSLNVAGNLAVGGVLSARSFQASSLVSDSTLLIGGHIITRGSAPGVSKGGALAGTDTVSISGSDAAGTVAVNIGAGAARSGIVANINFVNSYGSTPRVVITAVGPGAEDVYVNRNANGFSIGVRSLGIGGHAFDYIVMQ